MTVKATKGLTIFMSNGTTPANNTATAVSNAKPAVVSTASTTGMKDGQVVHMTGTGMPSIDGKDFIVANLVADTSYELLGSDASNETAPAAAGTGAFYDDTVDLVKLCLSSIGINPESGSPVSVATFCDPTATVPGLEGGAGTLDLGFYLDKDSTGYAALLKAEADGNERIFVINFPSNGTLIARGTVGSLNFTDIPLEGSAALTAQVTLSSKPVHRF